MESDDYIEYGPHRKHRFAAGMITMGLLLSSATAADEVFNNGQGFEAVADFKGQLHDDNSGLEEPLARTNTQPSPSPETTPSAQPESNNTQCIAELSLRTRLGQMLIIGVRGDELSENTALFAKRHVGGAIIMSSPANPYDGSIKDFKNAGKIPMLIGTDEEGGARQEGGVQRFRNLGELPLASNVPRNMSAQQLSDLVTAHGKKLNKIGIDMVFGPTADVSPKSGKAAIPGRTYGPDAAVVTKFAEATIEGWKAADILPTLKHFPGLGRATGNTDYEPASTPPLDELRDVDLVPYQDLSSTGAAIMVGNQKVPGLTRGQPASLSPEVVQLLRNDLGYANNLVVTDSLNAKAISNVQDAITQALVAGADMAMVVDPPNGQTIQQVVDGAINKLVATTGELLPEAQINASVARILAAKGINNACTLS